MQKGQKKAEILLFLAPLTYLIVSVIVVMLVIKSNAYPRGSDTMYHVYRGNMLYHSILKGNWWPQIDAMWYNGVELMRYWAPLPAFFMAACQALGGGDPMEGYLIFVGLICFLGALPWLYIGRKTGRPLFGALMGILWFFMPNNLLALFSEGNLARSICMIFLPIFIFKVFEYLQERDWHYLWQITVCFALMALCHLGYAGMIALSMLLLFAVHGIITGEWRAIPHLILAIVLGFAVLGVWALPSLVGGITSMDTSENMRGFFQSAWVSLNPFERYESSNGNFYFGLAAFVLAVFGGIFGYKKTSSGFWTSFFIFLCTTTSAYSILRMFPGSQYLWMLRFISIALCMILYCFLRWDTLKKPFIILLCVLLCLDTVPSLSLIYGYGESSGMTVEERMDRQQEVALLNQAQQLTEQRLAFMDESTLGSTGSWLVSAWNNPVPGTFGAGWEAAVTGTNISQLNRSLAGGNYYYLFDRCMELGNDTVVIKRSRLPKETNSEERLAAAAAALGYELADSDAEFFLYHLNQKGNWGTVSKYRALGIGAAASAFALQFPSMKETTVDDLCEYTFDELSEYELIYLSHFTYTDRAYAEQLVLDLSEAGVHIVIAADGIPEDRKSHDQSFLGVRCNFIEFKNGYPVLDTVNGLLYTDLFPDGYFDWKTVYVDGLDEVWGVAADNDLELAFLGTVKNDNIVVVGINLPLFYSLTRDVSVEGLLNMAMRMSPAEVPQREIVPIQVDWKDTMITVTSPRDDVNTSLAYHDIFDSDAEIKADNNLTLVGRGVTHISLKYPYLWQGICVSTAAIALTVLQLLYARKRFKEEQDKKPDEREEN